MSELPRWRIGRIEEALERLARVTATPETFGAVEAGIRNPRNLQAWLYAAASGRGLEVEPLRACGGDIAAVVRESAPALVVVQEGVLAVQRVHGNRAALLVPEGGEKEVALEEVSTAVCALWEHRYQLRSIDRLLHDAHVAPESIARARDAFLRQQLKLRRVEVGWSVRFAASSSVLRQLSLSRMTRTLAMVSLALVLVPTTNVVAWALLGRGMLDGTFDRGWLIAWGIALTTGAMFQVFSSFWQESAAIALGALIKKRLLLGALRVEPNTTRREGLGLTMGRVLESNSIEDLSISGGLLGLTGLAEFAVALLVMFGVRWFLGVTFLLFLVVVIGVCGLYFRRAKRWTVERVRLTHGLIERLIGARTRSVQEHPTLWHADEDRSLSAYATESQIYDRFSSLANVILQRGALLIGVIALIPLFVSDSSASALWAGLGGVLLAQQALTRIASGLPPLARAAVAWRSAAPLFRAAGQAEEPPTAAGLVGAFREIPDGAQLLRAHNIHFRFAPDRQPVLREMALEVRVGDRVLVEGSSGSGKSTLASVVAGIYCPQTGLMLLGGLDRGTLGVAGWRKRVAAAPQYHENHIFQGTLAFNLLIGREWPASAEDLTEAEQVCRELGFGPMLKRMPSGIMQVVGPAGWRLSHGEQSRVFIARALLQRSDLVVLDESFAALDPESVQMAMECVQRRARTLMVVAHP